MLIHFHFLTAGNGWVWSQTEVRIWEHNPVSPVCGQESNYFGHCCSLQGSALTRTQSQVLEVEFSLGTSVFITRLHAVLLHSVRDKGENLFHLTWN